MCRWAFPTCKVSGMLLLGTPCVNSNSLNYAGSAPQIRQLNKTICVQITTTSQNVTTTNQIYSINHIKIILDLGQRFYCRQEYWLSH